MTDTALEQVKQAPMQAMEMIRSAPRIPDLKQPLTSAKLIYKEATDEDYQREGRLRFYQIA
jgi:hypothetical protein